MPNIIATRLLKARKQYKLTQDQLAKEVYLTKQVISNIERGVTTSINEYNLNLLSYRLNTNRDYLSGDSDDPNAISISPSNIDFISEFQCILTESINIRNVETLQMIKYLMKTKNKEDVEIINILLVLLRSGKSKHLILDILTSIKNNI